MILDNPPPPCIWPMLSEADFDLLEKRTYNAILKKTNHLIKSSYLLGDKYPEWILIITVNPESVAVVYGIILTLSESNKRIEAENEKAKLYGSPILISSSSTSIYIVLPRYT